MESRRRRKKRLHRYGVSERGSRSFLCLREGWFLGLPLTRAVTGGGRVRSPSGPPALIALNLRLHRKAGRLGDATLPVPTAFSACRTGSTKPSPAPKTTKFFA